MQHKELSAFVPDQSWKEHNGALLVIAHPDDEIMMGWGVIQTFIDAGIPVTVLLMTLGENGKINGATLSSEETARIRRQEFESAAHALGVSTIISDPLFADSNMKTRQSELNQAVVQTVRDGSYDVIVSFAPGEHTYQFDHQDHHAVSEAARMASETADMTWVFPSASVKPLPYRPAFLGWTTNPDIGASHQMSQIPLSEESRMKRTEFLSKHYASQFSEASKSGWEPIFDRLTRGEPNESHRQLLFRIR